MAESRGLSWPTKIAFQWVLTVGLVWFLSTNIDQYFFLNGGLAAYVIIGSLLTLMNLIIRPLLHIVFAPFHLIFGLIATILMNWLFLWIIIKITDQMNPALVQLTFNGGVGGWLVIAIILGAANWVMKILLKV